MTFEYLIFQYVALSLMVFAIAIPFILYKVFMTGGEIIWWLQYPLMQLFDIYVPRVCFWGLILYFLNVDWYFLDWGVVLGLVMGMIVAAFVVILVPSAITKGRSNNLVRRLVPGFHGVAILSQVGLFASLIFDWP